MCKKNIIYIKNKAYSLSNFTRKYKFSYTTVYRYYQKGYRDKALLDIVRKNSRRRISALGYKFDSKLEAAKFLGIPKTTFYNWIKSNNVDKLNQYNVIFY